MDELRPKLEELLKGLFALKEQQGPFVPAIKPPSLNSTIKPPSASFKVNSPPAAPKVAGGLPPTSKKDPAKVAEQLRNPRPQKVQTEILKFEDNGQWNLEKAAIGTAVDRHGDMPMIGKQAVGASPSLGSPSPAPAMSPKLASVAPVKPTAGAAMSGPSTASLGGATPDKRAAAAVARQRDLMDYGVRPDKHGFKTHTEEQNNLINGLLLHNTVPVNQGKQGAAWAISTQHGDSAIVKNSIHHEDRDLRGHLRNNFNSARREVLYHDLAKQFFGMGQYVPTTAGFTVNGEDWSAQKKVGGASSPKFADDGDNQKTRLENRNHERVLRNLNNNGELDKMAIMDHLMGHHDRHPSNFMIDKVGNRMHLIDNGTAFDYGNADTHPTPWYRKMAQDLKLHGEGGHDSRVSFHPEAAKWLMGLNPEEALKVFEAHGHNADSPAIRGFVSRLLHLQDEMKKPDAFLKKPDRMMGEGKARTHQKPEEYQ